MAGELQPPKEEAKPSDGKVDGVMPNSENNSTLDYLKSGIRNYIEAFPSLKTKFLTILLTLIKASNNDDEVCIYNKLYPPTQPQYHSPKDFLWTTTLSRNALSIS